MENVSPDDLQKEISRLWEKVGSISSSPAEPPPPASVSVAASSEVAWETVAMLKSQQRRQEARWQELLEAREAALNALKERQALMEAELTSLRQKVRADDDLVVAQVMDVGSRLEAAQKALADERAGPEAERRDLKALVEAARESAAAEAARWREEERRWEKREQQYLLDLQELQALSARRQEESQRADDAARGLSDSLGEARGALEKTLAELLRERRVRQESEAERAKAVQKIAEVEKHFEELSRIWEEERAQWRELWDRERSAWETQRLEFSAWEENLRKEREAWHASSAAQDQAQVKFAEQLTRNLRDTSATSEKLAAVMGRIAQLETRPAADVPRDSWQPPRPSWGRRFAPALAAAAVLAVLAWPLGRWLTGWSLQTLGASALALDNPTALASDGSLLWVSDWKGTLEALDPRDLRAPVRSLKVSGLGVYRPVALALGRERFYTLDAAQARIVRHQPRDPAVVLYAKPTPGPAPTALAWDGAALWSYDAVNKSLYRHGSDESDAKAYALPSELVPTAMQWLGRRLWLFDSRGRRLMAFEIRDDSFVPVCAAPVDDSVLGLAAAGTAVKPRAEEIVALAGPSARRTGFALMRYRIGWRLFTIF
ncbi:MAG: hypothetical protein HY926_04350 [Elusimicrobia bacterium]|nr:hypothetical protein [Elusimicrobiota bacterium]